MPGGLAALTYASTATIRLPVDIAFTEQSASDEVLERLEAELAGTGAPTGFEPARGDDAKITVSFVTCIVHAQKMG
jgi:hypothetical protein